MKSNAIQQVRYNFFNTAVADILRAIDGKSLMGSLILSFCCIDHIAQGTKPSQKTTRSDYKECVELILGKINPRYKEISEEIYAIRNSLVHSYGQSDSSKKLNLRFLVSANKYKDNHLSINNIDNQNILLIDIPLFISEIICSVDIYFHIFSRHENLIIEWYDNQIKIFSNKINISDSLSSYHRLLHYFDKKILLNEIVISLSEDIRRIITEK